MERRCVGLGLRWRVHRSNYLKAASIETFWSGRTILFKECSGLDYQKILNNEFRKFVFQRKGYSLETEVKRISLYVIAY